jgi:hypothetical protein
LRQHLVKKGTADETGHPLPKRFPFEEELQIETPNPNPTSDKANFYFSPDGLRSETKIGNK